MNILGALSGTALAVVVAGVAERTLPVVAMMEAVTEARVFENYVARVEGYKIKDCLVVSDSFVGWKLVNNTWTETPFEFVADATPNESNPSSWQAQDFGVWKWYGVSDNTEKVRLSLLHNCDGKLTITNVNFNL